MAFERDLEYLKAFLDKLGAAAQAMPAGAGRQRLVQLLGEQNERWAEIAKLLAGEPARSSTEFVQTPAAVVAKPSGLTVGSLRRT